MAKVQQTSRQASRSQHSFSTIIAAITLMMLLIYFAQSALLIAAKHPLDAAVSFYQQQQALENSAESAAVPMIKEPVLRFQQ
ncbi:hypothetical protein [Psychromonas ossibalaenae]|uniref:hypothetical protein n=1 Tax=Psychromonas ossibalaenae TaxID=444922 RepID=UPI000380D89E|nr:hypothetical protein [Psychromonas ossibalaenae]